MRAYIYWPFARIEDSELFRSIGDGDWEVVLHTLNRSGVPVSSTARSLTVVADLPDAHAHPGHPLAWLNDRRRIYQTRQRLRAEEVRNGKFDVVHAGFLNRFTDWSDPTWRKFAGPRLATVHDVHPHSQRLPFNFDDRLLKRAYSNFDRLIVLHDAVRRQLLDAFMVAEEKVVTIPHWVTSSEGGSARELGATPSVLMLGTLRTNKGVPQLLEAVGQLPDLHFVIAGRGDPGVESLVLEAAERFANLDAEIGWVSPQRKSELLHNADIMALPYSSFASQSGVLQDALGASLPVVATDVGALGETVRGVGAGVVTEAGSAGGLTAGLGLLAGDPEFWSSCRDNAASYAKENSPAKFASRLRDEYRNALGDTRA